MDFKYVSGDERENLYKEVWTEPMITVAKRYNMSDSVLRKNCRRLGIPLATSGYWSKIKAGKKVAKDPLPDVYGIIKKYVHGYVIKLKDDIKKISDNELISDEELSLLSTETVRFIRDKCSKIQVKMQLRNPHRLIIEHKEGIKNRKKRSKDIKQVNLSPHNFENINSVDIGNEPILPINVSNFNINRAYRIVDSLINTLDEMEGRILVRRISEKDVGGFLIMHTIFYFEVEEGVNKVKAKKLNSESKNILVMSIKAEGYLNSNIVEQFQYKDTINEPLELQLSKIIYDMFVVANKFRAIDELEDRKQDRKWEEEKRQRRLEKMRKGELEEVKLLEQAVSDWNKAQRIRMFAEDMEKELSKVVDNAKKEKILRWLEWSRNKADWLDPLTAKEDELLGKSKHIFDIINED